MPSQGQARARPGGGILFILFLSYLLDCIDRQNIGYVQDAIRRSIGMSVEGYGLSAGIFFIGYILFEIPFSMLGTVVGERRLFTGIMILWGLVSVAMAAVQTQWQFHGLRFLLGVFQAGFAPCVLYYLSAWYPPQRLASVVALQQMGSPAAGILVGPLTGTIQTLGDGMLGLAGWQWVFVLEGLPSLLLGVIVFFYLPDTPSRRTGPVVSHGRDLFHALRDPVVYWMAIPYFAIICGIDTISFWLPGMIRNSGIHSSVTVGFLGALSYLMTIFAMYVWARRTDRGGGRAGAVALPLMLGAACLAVMPFVLHSTAWVVGLAMLGNVLIYAAYAVFWAMPAGMIGSGPTGYALINSIGLIGGFASPVVIGRLYQSSGSLDTSLWLMGTVILVGAIGVFLAPARYWVGRSGDNS
ncbi:MFS transporter [Gluconacetobacter sp. Hr-1-5]|uniref:MFS transporter n=1 Tax=Gluconacetobacter sp. Hr-1-5 TaxID=3395370 RepID=UPI003B51D7B0